MFGYSETPLLVSQKDIEMYNSSSEALPVASGKKLRSFFVTEIETYLKDHNCSEFDRESLKELITVSLMTIC